MVYSLQSLDDFFHDKNRFQPFSAPAGYAHHNPSKCTQVECVRVNVLHGIAVNDSQPFVDPSLWLSNPLKETQPTESVGEGGHYVQTGAFQLGPYKVQLLTLFFIHFTQAKKDFHHYSILVTDTPKKDVSATEKPMQHIGFSPISSIQLESVLHSNYLKCRKNIYHQVRSRIVIRPH
jgi:hypothetical protein